MKAIMLLDSHPDHESLVVLPDYPRYRDLARRTQRGRGAAGVHVVFVTETGTAESDTWAGGIRPPSATARVTLVGRDDAGRSTR